MVGCRGRLLLRKFLEDNGILQSAAALAIGVSAPTMSDWLAGHKRPSDHMRTIIARWTNGAVPESAWLFAEETRAINAVKAFRATGS